MKVRLIIIALVSLSIFSCKQKETLIHKKELTRKQPKTISYSLENSKIWLKQNASDSSKLKIVMAINRTDKANLSKHDSIIIPKDYSGDLVYYLPFPLEVTYLKEVTKVVMFSYPTQTFATYENGVLTYAGPTNMGRKKDKTPTGLFYTNWKAETTTSTFDDEWKLKWNFNIENKLGVGFHEYALPGLPVSHSCLRLLEEDAKFLYSWANQWILEDNQTIKVKGTPVIVFGAYQFEEEKPWLQLIKNPKALDISESEIEKEITPFLQTILTQQKVRENYTKTTTK